MKKFLLITLLSTTLGMLSNVNAQCSGANVSVTNFAVVQSGNSVNYSFNWEFVKGNASIQVFFFCNNVQIGTRACMSSLKDSTAGVHTASGNFPTNCNGALRVEIRVYSSSNCNGNFCSIEREINMIPLPVNLKSFNANRSKSSVGLVWETSTEMNNKGFEVQRKVGGNEFATIAFVSSKAQGGNSESELSYSYTDQNAVKGLSQYRLLQIDLDGKSKYSDVKSVRGEEQSAKTIVYPNPSNNGVVNVVFEDTRSVRDIQLMDINGRTVNQWRNYANNNVRIENLVPGFYNLRIVDQNTKEQSMEKIIINKY